jgi:hypothetical protein
VFLNDRAQQTFDDTTIAMPPAVAGYTQNTTPQAQQLVDRILAGNRSGEFSDVKGGVYNDAQGRVAIVSGMKANEPITGDQLSGLKDMFAGLQSSGVQISSVVPVSAGRLGGQLQCGAAVVEGAPVKVCAGVDVAAATLMVFFDPNVPNTTVLAVREAVVVRP